MKSFSKFRSEAAQASLQTWQPADLDINRAVSTPENPKKQILSIFQNGEDGIAVKKEMPSQPKLRTNNSGQNFPTWRPGEMSSTQPKSTREAPWIFAETSRSTQNTQSFEFGALEEAPSQDKPDSERKAVQILEQARLQAEEMILAAQAEADEILSQAQSEIDEQKKEAYQQGIEQAHRELEETLKATRVMVEEVHNWQAELASQGQMILLEMLKEIAQKVFGEGIELDTNALQINLNRIMETAHGLGDLNIFLNPRDAKNLDPSWSEYQMLISGDRVKIIPSGKITRGGCFVQGEMGSVDGRVETQLNAVLKAIDEASE